MKTLFFSLSILWITACSVSDKESFIPGYSGNFGEVVLVCTDHVLNSSAGKEIQGILQEEQYGLPQPEATFTLITATKTNFLNVFRTHRNVVLLTVDGKQQGATLELFKSKWARGQVDIEISGSSVAVLKKEISKRKKDILRILNNAEINRLIDKFQKFSPEAEVKKLKSKLGLTLSIHKDAYVEELDSNMAWIRVERQKAKGGYEHQISQGILVYKVPYTDRMQFLDDSLQAFKDRLTRDNLPGPSEGSYITTEYRYSPPYYTETTVNNSFAKESRGLWRMENNFMGGPFYFVTMLNEKDNEVIYLYGYVFSPEFNKREYLREVEAMMKSIRF